MLTVQLSKRQEVVELLLGLVFSNFQTKLNLSKEH
jgi:hypothetical protein